MFKLTTLVLTLMGAILATLPAHADIACAFGSPPSVLMQDGDAHLAGSRLLQMWEVPDHPVLWSQTAPESGTYSQFRAEVARRDIETDPLRLLERSPTENNLVVLRNADDWIEPAGCLEMLLYGHQHGRMDTLAAPTEFASIVLRSPDGECLRIYFYTINQDGIGRMDPVADPALADMRDGWEVLIVLHNHAFHPGQPEIDGILAPSESDADFHAKFHDVSAVREAWITNGIHTVRMPASSFDEFQGPSEGGAAGERSE